MMTKVTGRCQVGKRDAIGGRRIGKWLVEHLILDCRFRLQVCLFPCLFQRALTLWRNLLEIGNWGIFLGFHLDSYRSSFNPVRRMIPLTTVPYSFSISNRNQSFSAQSKSSSRNSQWPIRIIICLFITMGHHQRHPPPPSLKPPTLHHIICPPLRYVKMSNLTHHFVGKQSSYGFLRRRILLLAAALACKASEANEFLLLPST